MICVGFLSWVQKTTPTSAPASALVPTPRTRTIPVPAPRTTIRETDRALRGYMKLTLERQTIDDHGIEVKTKYFNSIAQTIISPEEIFGIPTCLSRLHLE